MKMFRTILLLTLLLRTGVLAGLVAVGVGCSSPTR